jgi:uncharacterized protein DUF3551
VSNSFLNWTSQAAIAGRIAECRRLQNWNELTIPGDYHLPFGKAEARAEVAKWIRRMILAAVIALAASVLGRHSAKAYEAPWCAVISEGYWDCQYRSIEECRPNALAGNRGWCNPSPYFVARPIEDRRFGKRRARAQ